MPAKSHCIRATEVTAVPTISVVVPCYNGGRFLDQLLASLRAQTFRDFEIVIVNDGSTDRATQEKLAALDPAIRVIHQENRGLSAARNAGFAAARADLVMALDCDDQLAPTYLAETLAALQSAGPETGFAFTHVRLVGGAHGIQKRYYNEFDILFKNIIGYSMLIRKAAWLKAGQYDESMRDGYEDWEFNIRLIGAGFAGIEIPKPLFIYTASTQGMLLGHSSHVHAATWRRIRQKHRDTYRLWNIARLFWKSRSQRTEMSAVRPIAQLLVSNLIPDSWHNGFIRFVRNYRMSRSKKAGESVGGRSAIRPDGGLTR
jgi:glycosyltransferase involved in cell wall biosynthesis